MGYDLHITRRDHWAEAETVAISFEEWMAYVESDKELALTNGNDFKIGSETEFQHRPGFCEWNGHPTENELHSRPWFSYWEGNIDTKNPDAPTIRKMMQIASVLHAKVQGDEGERYTEEYLAELESKIEQKTSSRAQQEKPWWRFW